MLAVVKKILWNVFLRCDFKDIVLVALGYFKKGHRIMPCIFLQQPDLQQGMLLYEGNVSDVDVVSVFTVVICNPPQQSQARLGLMTENSSVKLKHDTSQHTADIQ